MASTCAVPIGKSKQPTYKTYGNHRYQLDGDACVRCGACRMCRGDGRIRGTTGFAVLVGRTYNCRVCGGKGHLR